MEKKSRVRKKAFNLFHHPGNQYNFELLYKFLSRHEGGLVICQAFPAEAREIFNFFDTDPLKQYIHKIDMVNPLMRPFELQETIIAAHEKYGDERDIFFIYNFENCIEQSNITINGFFEKMNLIRDFFMGFKAAFVFFMSDGLVKKMIQNAFDFYDWIKFTFIFTPGKTGLTSQLPEFIEDEIEKYSGPHQKIEYLKQVIRKVTDENEKVVHLTRLAGLYRQVHDYDEALKLFFEALEIEQKRNNSKSIAFIYSNIGRIYFYKSMQKNGSTSKAGNLEIDSYVEKAIASFETALSLDPRHVPTLNSYANACVEWGEKEKAKMLFEKILSLDPRHKGARPNI